MKRTLPFIAVLLLLLSCGVQTKFEKSTTYTDTQSPSSLFLIVVGDADNAKCLDYYKQYLTDTLKAKKIKADGFSDYRVTKKNTDLTFVNDLIEAHKDRPYILTAVVTKSIVGYGASSSRTLKLALINTDDRKVTWSGQLTANFSWYISDADYRNVARQLCLQTITELQSKGIVK
jgi:hypothetical protein